MKAGSRIGLGLTLLAVCAAIVPVAPASGEVVLHRDPAAAVPFVAQVGGSESGPTLRRDGSAAVPFVAQVGPDRTSGGDGFDWGDAAMGRWPGGCSCCSAAARCARGAGARGGSRSPRRGQALSARAETGALREEPGTAGGICRPCSAAPVPFLACG